MSGNKSWLNNNIVGTITFALVIGGATWTIFNCLLDDRKEDLHKTELSGKQTELNQYNSRVDVLEKEKQDLITENLKYKEWLQSSPDNLAYLEKKIKLTPDTVFVVDILNKDIAKSKRYTNFVKALKVGGSFLDKKTAVAIGVSEIDVMNQATGEITLPNKPTSITFDRVKLGKSWRFDINMRHYMITLAQINYSTKTFSVELMETGIY